MSRASWRKIEAGDQERLRQWRNQPEIRQWMYTHHEISKEEHQRWFRAALIHPDREYYVVLLDEMPVGLAYYYEILRSQGRGSWGYYLAEASARGKGLATWIEYQMIERAFSELALKKLCCEVIVRNEAVWKFHLSVGFQQEALYKQHLWRDGQGLDVMGLGLLASDWPALRPALQARILARGYTVEKP